MAIPSQQIGWSQKSKLLWQISKQLEALSGIMYARGNQSATYYNVAGCERMEYHVIKYTGAGTLAEGTIVNNDTPECWFIVDQATGPEDVGTITYVWDTPSDCQPCINSHTTTTTTTTVGPFINTIIISNGSLSATNGTYTRPDIATAFSQVGGTGTIFFGGDAWYLNSGIDGNAARNTSELGTGTWEAWAPGNSSGITAEYIYSNTTTTTTTIV
jgi:hypothetical protein